jgi:hypothetical protein
LEQAEGTLRLASLEGDWLNKLLKADPAALNHARVKDEDDRLVLTASTKELQAFVLAHLTNAAAWAEPTELKRTTPRTTGK